MSKNKKVVSEQGLIGDPDIDITDQYPTQEVSIERMCAGGYELSPSQIKDDHKAALDQVIKEVDTPDDPDGNPPVRSADVIRKIRQIAPDLTEAEIQEMDDDEINLFTDLGEVNNAIMDVAKDLQSSAELGGPTSIVGFIRLFMRITNTGVGDLASAADIQRLRMVSILEETVDMEPGEVDRIQAVLLPRYERWKAIQAKPQNTKRAEAREKKRLEKKRKKTVSYDRITGIPR